MAIENFTKAAFESALTAAGFDYASAGVDPDTQQYIYLVKPDESAYSIRIWSSLQANGVSGAEAGGDSIRAVIVKGGSPYGGKNRRWVDRRRGWQRRLTEMLASLANQISYLGFKCNGCGTNLMPFTSRTTKNPQRPFVKCPNADCKSQAFAWTEGEEGQPIKPQPSEPEEQQEEPLEEVADSPECPVCGSGMRRMGSGKGWRCDTPGNTWDGKKWTVCGGIIWDKPATPQNAPQTAPEPQKRPDTQPLRRTPQNANQGPQNRKEPEGLPEGVAMLLYTAAMRLRLLAKSNDHDTQGLIKELLKAAEADTPLVAH